MANNPFEVPKLNYDVFGTTSEKEKSEKAKDKCPPHLRKSIRQRWWGDKIKGRCFCCGRDLHFDDAEVGRIKAGFHGGKYTPENCRLICRTCNSGMGKKNMKIYMKNYFPERYEKSWPKSDKIDTMKKSKVRSKKKKSKRQETNIFGLPKFEPPKFDVGI